MNISHRLKKLIEDITRTSAFWKLNYYFRALKKAPHGGVFYITKPNMFLKYYDFRAYEFFIPNTNFPFPLMEYVPVFKEMFENSGISIEEILIYCLGIDPQNKSESTSGNKMYIACCGEVLKHDSKDLTEYMHLLPRVLEGYVSYDEDFTLDEERLMNLFILMLIERNEYIITDIEDILTNEIIKVPSDKYGLYDVTEAHFERQGFKIDDRFYLYNIFLDTSIGDPCSDVPHVISLLKQIQEPYKLFMRCDENLSVLYENKVTIDTMDFEKWRGITLNFDTIDTLVKSGKETIVHYDSSTYNKILVYVNRGLDESGKQFYHINVEQLWNPELLPSHDKVITTNYIHGTYYPSTCTFEHIDYSINQYDSETYQAKYSDAECQTGVSIGKYGSQHYKIWCVRGEYLTVPTWIKLVCASIDFQFRNIFMETIGGKYIFDEYT